MEKAIKDSMETAKDEPGLLDKTQEKSAEEKPKEDTKLTLKEME